MNMQIAYCLHARVKLNTFMLSYSISVKNRVLAESHLKKKRNTDLQWVLPNPMLTQWHIISSELKANGVPEGLMFIIYCLFLKKALL